MGQLGAVMPQGLPWCWGCGVKPGAAATRRGAGVPGFPSLVAVDGARPPSLREERASAHPEGCGNKGAGGPGGRCTGRCSVPGSWEVERGP